MMSCDVFMAYPGGDPRWGKGPATLAAPEFEKGSFENSKREKVATTRESKKYMDVIDGKTVRENETPGRLCLIKSEHFHIQQVVKRCEV